MTKGNSEKNVNLRLFIFQLEIYISISDLLAINNKLYKLWAIYELL